VTFGQTGKGLEASGGNLIVQQKGHVPAVAMGGGQRIDRQPDREYVQAKQPPPPSSFVVFSAAAAASAATQETHETNGVYEVASTRRLAKTNVELTKK
jgi:hypothetical protein